MKRSTIFWNSLLIIALYVPAANCLFEFYELSEASREAFGITSLMGILLREIFTCIYAISEHDEKYPNPNSTWADDGGTPWTWKSFMEINVICKISFWFLLTYFIWGLSRRIDRYGFIPFVDNPDHQQKDN